jgi:hypothetical protein
MNGTIHIELIRGTNNLGSVSIDTHLGNNSVNLYGYNSTPASAVLNGGSFNLGTGSLGLLGGLTLNADTNTGTFSIGDLILSSANGAYFYRGGQATVNWNDSGNTIRAIFISTAREAGRPFLICLAARCHLAATSFWVQPVTTTTIVRPT